MNQQVMLLLKLFCNFCRLCSAMLPPAHPEAAINQTRMLVQDYFSDKENHLLRLRYELEVSNLFEFHV